MTTTLEIINDIIFTELNNQVMKYEGNYVFYNDASGQLRVEEPSANNPFAFDEVDYNPFQLIGLAPQTQPFKDRNFNYFNIELRIGFRIEDKDQAVIDMENFSDSFTNNIIEVEGIKFNFLIPKLSPISETQFNNGDWLVYFSTQIKLSSASDVTFPSELSVELSVDNITYSELQYNTIKESRGAETLNEQPSGTVSKVSKYVKNELNISLSYLHNPNDVVHRAIRDYLRFFTKQTIYYRVTEGGVTTTYQMILESVSRDLTFGTPIIYGITLKEEWV